MVMPRTIDKLRSQLPGGNSAGYVINGKIQGLSGFLLERLGISEAELREVVRLSATEKDIALWLRKRTDASQYAVINQTLRRIKPKRSADERYFRSEYEQTLKQQPNLELIIDIVDADDRRVFGQSDRASHD